MKHFAFCVNDAYVPYIAVTIKSIRVHHPDEELVFHILTDGVSEKNRARLQDEVADDPGVSCHIITVDRSKVCRLRKGKQHESVWYRVLLPEYLSDDVHRILFLDADTLVTGSLDALFELDLDGRSVAGCLDPLSFNADTFERLEYDPALKYLCAGVLMINLDYWREHGLEERIIAFATDQAERLRFWDQDAVNYVCRDTKLVLPLRYGVMSCFFWPAWVGRIGSKEELPVFQGCTSGHPEKISASLWNHRIHPSWLVPFHPLSRMLFHEDWQRYNKMLRRPVVRRYSLKGFKLLKLFAWNIVFPGKRKDRLITREKALKFIS